jgi:hypothetical protein
MHAGNWNRAALDAAELTVLLGLVRRAKANAERRQRRRQHLGKIGSGGDPSRTKVNKLRRLLAKLEEIQAHLR